MREYDVKTLASVLNVTPSTIYNLKKGRYKQPDTEVFFQIIEHFNVSADYMLGFIEFPSENIIYYPPLRQYGNKIRKLLQEKAIKQSTLITDLKISSNLLYKWLAKDTLPTVESLIKLSNYFDISIDTFIERIK